MFQMIKRLLGMDDYAEKLTQRMLDNSKKYKQVGAEIANDCLVNGLRKGEPVKLSKISEFIEQNYYDFSKPVESGFLLQMYTYIDTGEVDSFELENGEIVFVHTDYKDTLLKND